MGIYEGYIVMNRSISLKLIVTLCCCFVTLVIIVNASLNDLESHASPVTPEKNSTFSNLSETDSADILVTTIIIPTGGSNVTQASSSSNNNNDTSFAIQSNNDTINDTQNNNVTNIVPNNNTVSDPQQRGKYLVDDNSVHYYNINNCSEKKGSSGIGDMSECEDAEKEMSED
jgi:hypothetical protein